MSFERTDRIAEELRREASDIIRNELKDPRLGDMVSLVACEVARDLSTAKLKVSVYAEPEKREAAMQALSSADGFIRRELSKRLTIRRVPELRFELDTSIEYSVHIAELLREIKAGEDHR